MGDHQPSMNVVADLAGADREADRRDSQRIPIHLLVREAALGGSFDAIRGQPRPRRRLLRRAAPAAREPHRGPVPHPRHAARGRGDRGGAAGLSRGRALRRPREVRGHAARCRARHRAVAPEVSARAKRTRRRRGARPRRAGRAQAGVRAVLPVPGGRGRAGGRRDPLRVQHRERELRAHGLRGARGGGHGGGGGGAPHRRDRGGDAGRTSRRRRAGCACRRSPSSPGQSCRSGSSAPAAARSTRRWASSCRARSRSGSSDLT